MVNTLIPSSPIPPVLHDPSLLVPSSLQAFSYQAWVRFWYSSAPRFLSPLSLLLLSCQSPSLDGSLTTFLSKLLFSVLSRSLRMLSALQAADQLPFSHSPHSCPRTSPSSSSVAHPTPLSGSRQPCSLLFRP